MIDRQHLKIINAIHVRGTMTEAAASLHLSQSALSHAMKKVETTFNVPVWRKEGRKLVLTQAGRSILGLAERVLPQFEHTESMLHRMAQGKQGILRIGMECHPCFEWLLKVVAPFLKAYPDADVDVRRAFSFGGLQALHGFDIDVLLTPDPLRLDTITYTPVFDYEQVLVMSTSHPLASVPFVRPADLSHATLITYPVELSRLDVFSQFLTPANCAVKAHKTIETTEIMLQMVAAGRGVTALPKWLIEESDKQSELAFCSLGESGIHKTLYLGHRKGGDPFGLVDKFIEMALSNLHQVATTVGNST